jgi:membrane-associated phospholipid phosphatase
MSKMNFIILLLAGASLFLFFSLTIAAKYSKTDTFDFDTTVKIQDRMPERLKKYLIKIAELGSIQVMAVLVLLTMGIQRKHFWIIGILFVLIAGIELYGKYELHHPPPPQFMILRFQHLSIDKYTVRENTASYPSGHAARSAFLVFLWIPYFWHSLTEYIKRHTEKIPTDFKITLPLGFILAREQGFSYELVDFTRILLYIAIFGTLLSFTFLIGFAKVYLGEHWMSDVLGGWLLGAGLGLITHLHLTRQNLPTLQAKELVQ